MSKTVEQLDSRSWKVTENFGSYTSVYIVYDDDPNKTDTRKSFERMTTEELSAVKSLIGAAGPQGTTGGTGAQGVAGRDGSNEGSGAQGATGPTGPAGSNGSNGGTGLQGVQGPSGSGGGGGGIASVNSNSPYLDIRTDPSGNVGVSLTGLTSLVRVSDGRSVFTLEFVEGLLVNVS